MRDGISHRDDDGNTYQRRQLDDGSEHVVLKNFPSECELRADMATHGRNAKYVSLKYYWLFIFEEAAAE
jgi:hypothetical protein